MLSANIPGRHPSGQVVAAICLGGMLGTGLRVLVGWWLPDPGWAVTVVNNLGAFGLAAGTAALAHVTSPQGGWWTRTVPFWATGCLGSFTTYSGLVGAVAPQWLPLHLVAGLVSGVAGWWCGLWCGRRCGQRRTGSGPVAS